MLRVAENLSAKHFIFLLVGKNVNILHDTSTRVSPFIKYINLLS